MYSQSKRDPSHTGRKDAQHTCRFLPLPLCTQIVNLYSTLIATWCFPIIAGWLSIRITNYFFINIDPHPILCYKPVLKNLYANIDRFSNRLYKLICPILLAYWLEIRFFLSCNDRARVKLTSDKRKSN